MLFPWGTEWVAAAEQNPELWSQGDIGNLRTFSWSLAHSSPGQWKPVSLSLSLQEEWNNYESYEYDLEDEDEDEDGALGEDWRWATGWDNSNQWGCWDNNRQNQYPQYQYSPY